MNTGKYILPSFRRVLCRRESLIEIVMKYEGNEYVKHFHMLEPVARMMFRAADNRDSLHDLTSIISCAFQQDLSSWLWQERNEKQSRKGQR